MYVDELETWLEQWDDDIECDFEVEFECSSRKIVAIIERQQLKIDLMKYFVPKDKMAEIEQKVKQHLDKR